MDIIMTFFIHFGRTDFNGILKIYFCTACQYRDNSWFYIDTGHSTKALEKRLLIEKVGATCSEMSAWQNIFVDNSINGFASFWHGNYEKAICLLKIRHL